MWSRFIQTVKVISKALIGIGGAAPGIQLREDTPIVKIVHCLCGLTVTAVGTGSNLNLGAFCVVPQQTKEKKDQRLISLVQRRVHNRIETRYKGIGSARLG